MFKQLESSTKRFEVKLMTLDVISRLVGLHDLFLFNFYPYLQRFMQPHQREVTRILQFAAQSSHELVPPDVLEPLLHSIANNFVTERNSADAMAIGINAIREICARCPLAMDEDLMQDLVHYKTYRERPVMMAERSLIHLFRRIRPELLHKKDRGRPTEAIDEMEAKNYGQVIAKDFVPGAEVLLKDDHNEVEVNSESGSDDDEWVDIPHSSDEEMEINSDVEEEEEEEEESEEGDEEVEETQEGDEEVEEEDEEAAEEDEEEEEVEEKGVDEKAEEKDIKPTSSKIKKQLKAKKKALKGKSSTKPFNFLYFSISTTFNFYT